MGQDIFELGPRLGAVAYWFGLLHAFQNHVGIWLPAVLRKAFMIVVYHSLCKQVLP